MGMILEILSHIVALDIAWLIGFVISNSLWVMLFAAAGTFLDDKGPIIGGFRLAFYVHALDFTTGFIGWNFGSGLIFGPIIVFVFQAVFDSFLGKTKFKFRRGIYSAVVFYVFLFGHNILGSW